MRSGRGPVGPPASDAETGPSGPAGPTDEPALVWRVPVEAGTRLTPTSQNPDDVRNMHVLVAHNEDSKNAKQVS